MKFVLAPDSFKESMSAKQAAEAMDRGIKKVFPNADCIIIPMADGGEGTVQSLVDATVGRIIKEEVTCPLGKQVIAEFGLLGDEETAIIEMASASGIMLVSAEDRDPLITTTYGTGELIKKALDLGVKKFIIGIGGSATNDGGAGMLQALGARLLDKDGQELGFGGGALDKLEEIDLSNFDPRIKDITVKVACDVNNPLTGENGASRIFGPQKGASEEKIVTLDNNLHHFSNIIKKTNGKDIEFYPGAGAAGGLGAGLLAFLDAELNKGVDLIIDEVNLRDQVKGADYVFTGEGSIDFQTKFGKTPIGVAKVGKEANANVIAFAGRIGENVNDLYDEGIDAIISIMQGASSLDQALAMGQCNLEKTVENICRIIKMEKR